MAEEVYDGAIGIDLGKKSLEKLAIDTVADHIRYHLFMCRQL